MNEILKTYYELLEKYGKQGWWPLLDIKGTNPTKTGSMQGYHPDNYDYPKTRKQIFEIIIGALLTQNTSWKQVEKSLLNLKEKKLLNPKNILNADIEEIKQAIKPSGYFNQKAERLVLIAEWFINFKNIPTRQELLKLKGIDLETADSILLYAFKQPEFVVDNYTKRIFSELKIIDKKHKYDEIKELFEKSIKKEIKNKEKLVELYQEYHALKYKATA
jgi:endonuclease III related protein